MRPITAKLLSIPAWLTSLLTPVVLILSAIRLLLTPAFLAIEYRTPGFPEDRYGFTLQDRLYWSRYALDYLLNDADISYLADLRFPDGETAPAESCAFMDDCTRLYNERELQHMADVKRVVKAALQVWRIALICLVALGLWAWRGGWVSQYRRAVRCGGWLTVGLMGAVMFLALAAFGFIFVLFHQIFFESGTWTFRYSDTLIRLFPERFWRDTFLVVGGMPTGVGFLLGFFLREK